MIRSHAFFLILLAFLAACGTSKVAKKSPKQFSAMDYPYIEKFHEGVRLKTRGQINEAITLFEQCLTLRQDDDAVYYALSELYLIKNEPAKSAEYIQKAAELDPINIWYTQEIAYMLFEKGDYPEAVKNFEKLIEHEPRNVEWLYGYAECLVKAGKPAEAIKALDRTEDQMGKIPELSIQKFKLYVEMKQPDKGIAEIDAARKVFPNDAQLLATLVDYYFQTGKQDKAIGLLEELVVASPENGRAHLALADIYRQQGKQEKSYDELKKAFDCEDIDLDAKMKILIGIHESSFKIDPIVFELIEQLIAMYPTDAKPYSIKGDFKLKEGKDNEALSAFTEALKYDKTQFPIWKQVMVMQYQNANYTALYVLSKSCLEYFPTLPTVYLFQGLSAVQIKKYDEAIQVLETGLEMVVNDKVMEAEIYGQLGEAYFGISNYEKGKVNYEMAIQLDPSSKLLKNNFAYRLALAKIDLDKANTLIDEVIKNTDVVRFNDTKGYVLFQQGKYSEAQVFFEKAYNKDQKDKVATEHVGDAAIKLGDKTKALEYWNKAKNLGSTNKNLDKKIEKKEYYDPLY